MASAPAPAVSTSTAAAPSAAVQALNAARQAAVDAGQSAYGGTKASLAAFTSANPTLNQSGGSGSGSGSFATGSPYNDPKDGLTPVSDTPATPTTPPLVTSAASRTTYANNVTGLQKSISNLNPGNSNVSIVDYLNKAGLPSDYASRSALAIQHGITGYTGSATQNMQLLGQLQGGGDGSGGSGGPSKGGPSSPVTQPASLVPADTSTTTTTPTSTTTPAATTATTTPTSNPDGTTTDPNDITAGLPPAIASAYKDVLTEQEQNIQQAQTTLAQAKATMTNDPAATAAAAQIEAQYSTLITAMQDKNNVVLGSYRTNAARNGSLQYANDMETNFMSDEMDRASGRLADLVTKENELVLKSNQAFANTDVKAFNAAQTALDKATSDKTTTLGKLLTATNAQVKAVQAQQRLDMTTKKNALTTDVTTSSKIADEMAQEISSSGITDQNTIDDYVKEMASANGITNLDILKSALVKAQAAASKASLAATNTRSIIQKRGTTGSGKTSTKGNGTDGSFNYTAGDTGALADLLNTGQVGGKATAFAGRGSDGFVDPGAYTAAYNSWIKQGGTPKGFLKVAPVTNVNPASYTSLPAALQPKAKASAAAPAYQA